MPTFGDLERALPSLYEYRWFIAGGAMVIAAALAWLVVNRKWHTYAWERRVPFAIGGAPVVLVGLFLAWSLASPLFINVTVEEEFPFAAQAVVPEGMEREDVESAMASMAMVDNPVMVEDMPPVSLMTASSMVMAGTPVTAIEAEMMSDMEQQSAPVALKAGSFRDADSFHKGSGDARIYSSPGGGLLLRLEDLNVTNGPALHVILSPHPDPMRPSDVKQPGYVDLGPLKGNRGDQNYTIPAGVDASAMGSVVIYCKPFSVVFSVASLNDS